MPSALRRPGCAARAVLVRKQPLFPLLFHRLPRNCRGTSTKTYVFEEDCRARKLQSVVSCPPLIRIPPLSSLTAPLSLFTSTTAESQDFCFSLEEESCVQGSGCHLGGECRPQVDPCGGILLPDTCKSTTNCDWDGQRCHVMSHTCFSQTREVCQGIMSQTCAWRDMCVPDSCTDSCSAAVAAFDCGSECQQALRCVEQQWKSCGGSDGCLSSCRALVTSSSEIDLLEGYIGCFRGCGQSKLGVMRKGAVLVTWSQSVHRNAFFLT